MVILRTMQDRIFVGRCLSETSPKPLTRFGIYYSGVLKTWLHAPDVVEKLPTLTVVFLDTYALYKRIKLREHGYFDACANLFTVRSMKLPNQSIVSLKVVMVRIPTG